MPDVVTTANEEDVGDTPHQGPKRPGPGGLLRVAVVGVGPRGLHCLELLAQGVAAGRPSALQIELFEPAPFPGAGAVYDPRQPDYLLMNFAARQIDAALSDPGARPRLAPGFLEWVARTEKTPLAPDAYPPRNLVGRYLHQRFLATRRWLARMGIDCRLHPHAAAGLRRAGPRWRLTHRAGESTVDECVITIGHGDRWCGPTAVRGVYPVGTRLSPDVAPSGSRVGVRGMSLSFIDACLALTVGRGGRFVPAGGHRLSYLPSGREPAVITPYSRTGRPMLPKPVAAWQCCPAGARLIGRGQAEVRHSRCTDASWLIDLIFTLTDEVLRIVRAAAPHTSSAEQTVRHWYERWTSGADPAFYRQQLENAYRVATGSLPPGPAWALGEVWRRVYPALVQRLSHEGQLAFAPELKVFGREMERIAFGPPTENVARLLALIDAGIVSTTHWGVAAGVASSAETIAIQSATATTPVDCCIDAVLPSGPETARTQQACGLLHEVDGVALTPDGGVITDAAGTVMDTDHAPQAGLRVFGRLCEGWILGHDTLNRQLHPEPRTWLDTLPLAGAAGPNPTQRGGGRAHSP